MAESSGTATNVPDRSDPASLAVNKKPVKKFAGDKANIRALMVPSVASVFTIEILYGAGEIWAVAPCPGTIVLQLRLGAPDLYPFAR